MNRSPTIKSNQNKIV